MLNARLALTSVVAGAAALAGTAAATAAPVAPDSGIAAGAAPIETVQYYGYGGPYYGYGYGYGYRPFYGPPAYRPYPPRVVCRIQPSYWGPRRVCFRSY